MRIISGIKKGKKILLPDASITRPLKDNVKENIFNILTHNKQFKIIFENINVIDFFSGSGSFGIECLSRNAKNSIICFVIIIIFVVVVVVFTTIICLCVNICFK